MTGDRMRSSGLTCGEGRALVGAAMDRPLDPGRRQVLDEHLAQCPGCARHQVELQQLRGRLRALPELELPPEALAGVWERTIGRSAAGADAPRSFRPRRLVRRFALAAAAALLAAAVLVPTLLSPPQPAGPAPEEVARATEELEMVLAVTGQVMGSVQQATVREALGRGVGGGFHRGLAEPLDRTLEQEVVPALSGVPLLSPTPFGTAPDRSSRRPTT
jgi:anti-sigma factor RsiW